MTLTGLLDSRPARIIPEVAIEECNEHHATSAAEGAELVIEMRHTEHVRSSCYGLIPKLCTAHTRPDPGVVSPRSSLATDWLFRAQPRGSN